MQIEAVACDNCKTIMGIGSKSKGFRVTNLMAVGNQHGQLLSADDPITGDYCSRCFYDLVERHASKHGVPWGPAPRYERTDW